MGKEIRAVFCDISKAFDRVWHRGLIYKLKSAGISGNLLGWFENYLKDREQRVVINGTNSDWVAITAGIPQGSILGPLLFLIYINDIVSDIHSTIKLFADDTSLYIIVDNPRDAAVQLNRDLDIISAWAKKWLVDFNPNKTKSLVISSKREQENHPQLFMDQIPIQEVTSHGHLGLIFNCRGSWTTHIDTMCDKAWKRVCILRKLKFILDRKSLQSIYFTFIRPLLEYADIVWNNCTINEEEQIEKIQLEAARIVTGTTKLISLSNLYKEIGWEKLSERRRKHKLITFFKMFHGNAPSYLSDLVPVTVGTSNNYNLRNSRDLACIRCRTSLYERSFLPSVIKEWNTIPLDIRENNSLSNFKKYLNRGILNPPNYYCIGNRREQALHARLRTNCSSLKYDLFRKGLIQNPYCQCGEIETSQHFFFHCPLYLHIRTQLTNTITNISVPSLELYLYGNTLLPLETNVCIFEAVQKFIVQSKRFD